MATSEQNAVAATGQQQEENGHQAVRTWFRRIFNSSSSEDSGSNDGDTNYRPKATLGILSDRQTDEVPGKTRMPNS